MPSVRTAGLVLFACLGLGDARRVALGRGHAAALTQKEQQNLQRLTESCQDYDDSEFHIGDTVRVLAADGSRTSVVALVGCAEDAQPGLVCLEEGKGCLSADKLRHVNTLQFTLNIVRSAAGQIVDAVSGDIKEQWHEVRMRLMALSVLVSDKMTQVGGELATAADVCDPAARAETKAKFALAVASIKSRLSMVVNSASNAATTAKVSAEKAAVAAVMKFQRFQASLAEQAGTMYEEHLKETVDALGLYLSGIASAATDVPEELVPEGLVEKIGLFTSKVADLSGKLAELSEETYDAVKEDLGAMQAMAGRLVSALARQWASLRVAIQEQAEAASAQLAQYSEQAIVAACNFDLKETARVSFDKLKMRFDQVVEATKAGVQAIKESLEETADNLVASVAAIGAGIKASVAKLYNSEAVQGLLATLREELEVLKQLVKEQSSLVQKSLSGFLRYFRRFIPTKVLEKLHVAKDKAQALAQKIRSQIEELTGLVTDGEATVLEVEDEDIVN